METSTIQLLLLFYWLYYFLSRNASVWPQKAGRRDHIFCDHSDHHSPENSWDRKKGGFTMWLTGDTTHSTSHVRVATSKLSSHCLCYISDIVSTTDVMGRDFWSLKLFLCTCYWGLCPQTLGIFTEVLFCLLVSGSHFCGSQFWEYRVIAPPADMLTCKGSEAALGKCKRPNFTFFLYLFPP